MTVPSTTSRNDYLGAGTSGPFPYGFLIYSPAHLRVTRQDIAGNVTTLTLGSDYSVSGVASPAGGAISTTVPLATGEKLTIRRVVPLTQLTDYRNQQGFYAEVVEQNLDLAVQALQQHDDQLGRAILANETEPGFSAGLPGPAARANQLLGFDAAGNPIATGLVSGALPSALVVQAVDTIAALKAVIAPTAGGLYQTRGYWAVGDGGAGLYRWNAGDSTADNGGTVIQLAAGGVGRWNAIFSAHVDPRCFGAKGDGSTDDTIAIQSAINASSGKTIIISNGSFKTTTTLSIPSGTRMLGLGGVINSTSNAPVLASKGWLDDSTPTGRTQLENLVIVCGNAGANQHGIILRDYYSTIRNCVINNPGGRGIYLTHLSNSSASVSGTLVENRILDCTVQASVGDAFWIGNSSNGKTTDGFLARCIGYLASGSTAYALFIGSSAGWTIEGFHSYGGTPDRAIGIANAYDTTVSGLYVENFVNFGVLFGATQGSLSVGNINIRGSSAAVGASAVGVDRSSSVTLADCCIGRINFIYDGSNAVYMLRDVNGGACRIYLANYSITGSGAGNVVDFYNKTALSNSYYRSNFLQIDGALVDSVSKNELKYGASKLPETFAIKWNGNGAQVINFPVAYLENYGKRSFILSIDSRSFDNGAVTCEFTGKVFLSAKVNGSDAWTIALTNLSTPSGFSANPSVSAAFVASDGGTITVSFTCGNVNAQGSVSIINIAKT